MSMHPPLKSLGQHAYEGYFDSCGGKSLVSGAPLPGWEGQTMKIQEAWNKAAARVLKASGITIHGETPNE